MISCWFDSILIRFNVDSIQFWLDSILIRSNFDLIQFWFGSILIRFDSILIRFNRFRFDWCNYVNSRFQYCISKTKRKKKIYTIGYIWSIYLISMKFYVSAFLYERKFVIRIINFQPISAHTFLLRKVFLFFRK